MKINSFHLLVLLFLFSSCAKLPVYESKGYSVPENKENGYDLTDKYDEQNKVRYGIADNDTNFYVQAVFRDRMSLMKIMRGGLILYFDPDGKKKRNFALRIEKTGQEQNGYAAIEQGLRYDQGGGQRNMPAMLASVYQKVTWDKDGKEFVFYRSTLRDPISVDLLPTENNELLFQLKIPLSEIPLQEGQRIFSLGIETGQVSSGNMQAGRSGGGMRPSGGMGGRGGGGAMRGSGSRGSGTGMRGGGQRPSGGGTPSGMNPIRIWFQVQL